MAIPGETITTLPGGGLGEALGIGLQKGAEQGLTQLLENFNARQKSQAKFQQDLESNINKSLEFQGFTAKEVSSEDKLQFKKEAREELEKGNPTPVQTVIEKFALEKKTTQPQQSFLSRFLSGQPFQPPQQPISQTQEAPQQVAQQQEQPTPRTEIAGVPIDEISPLALSFLAGSQAFTTKEGRESIKEGGKDIISGSTLGLSENIPALKAKKPTTPIGKSRQVLGRILGAIEGVPGLFEKFLGKVGIGVGAKVAQSSQSAKILKGLASQIATKSAIRTAAGTGVFALNAFIKNGEVPSTKELVKRGGMIAGIGGAFDILGDAAIPLVQSLSNIAKKEGISNWEVWSKFGEAIRKRGFSFLKGKSPANTVTPQRILQVGKDFTSVKALPNIVQDTVKQKAQSFKVRPETIAQAARTVAENQGIDINAVEQGQPEVVEPFNRIVNDLSKSQITLEAQKVVTTQREAQKPPIAKQLLQERRRKELALSRQAAKSPEAAFIPSIKAEIKPTTEQLDAQILDSFDKIRDEIRNPEKVDLKKVERRAEADKGFIEKADAVLKRGELPPSGIRGTFIRIKEQYIKAYKDMIDFNNEVIRDNIDSSKARLVRVAREAQQMNKILETRMKRAQGDLVLQNNKRAIQKLSEGAKGSFFRNQLKKLRGDIDLLQQQIFEHQKIKSALEQQTELTAKEILKQNKELNKFLQKPTVKKAERLAKDANIDIKPIKKQVAAIVENIDKEEETLGEALRRAEEPKQKEKKKASKEKAQEQQTKEKKKAKTKEEKEAEKQKAAEEKAKEKQTERETTLGKGLFVGLLKVLIKEALGIDISTRALGIAIGSSKGIGILTLAAAFIKKVIKSKRVHKFRRLKEDANAIKDFTNELRKKGITEGRITNMKNQAGIGKRTVF